MTQKIYTVIDLHYRLDSPEAEAELLRFLNDPGITDLTLKQQLLSQPPDQVLEAIWRRIDQQWANTIADPIRLT